MKQDDFVGRLGGDEFIIILKTEQPYLIKNEIINRIKQQFTSPFYIENYELLISTSIGVAEYPQNGTTIKDLLNYSDQIMYKNKNNLI